MAPPAVSPRIKTASRAAFWLGALTVLAMVTGVLLITVLGGTSGRDLGSTASGAAIRNAAPLLVAAELLKLGLGACQAGLVRYATEVQGKWRAGALLTGYVGAALIAASGLVGIYALVAESRELGALAPGLGFASVGATAMWVIIFLGSTTLSLKSWLRIVGVTFAIAGLVSLVMAPVAMLAGIFGLVWWFGLSRALASASRP